MGTLAYLNFQNVVSANTLVMHLVVGIIGIASGFVLNEGKATS